MTEILAIIPARAGSKRIPDKNIKPLGGMPLIEHTILSAVGCELIDHIVISSDITNLHRYERKYYPAMVSMVSMVSFHRRPDPLCGDDVGDYDVINDVMQSYGDKWDLVVYLRPTTPFRADYHLCTAIKTMLSADRNATGLRSVQKMGESAFKAYMMPTPWLTPICDDCVDKTDWPDQQVTPTFKPNGYVDICKPATLAKGQLWGDWCVGYVTPETIEIDTPRDWEYAEWHINRSVDAPMRFGRRVV
jgi:CMP-N,N'-diacetyllegionaminic acid synthase